MPAACRSTRQEGLHLGFRQSRYNDTEITYIYLSNNYWCSYIGIRWFFFPLRIQVWPVHTSTCFCVTHRRLALAMTVIIPREPVLWFPATLHQIRPWLAPATKAQHVSFDLALICVAWKWLRWCLRFGVVISLTRLRCLLLVPANSGLIQLRVVWPMDRRYEIKRSIIYLFIFTLFSHFLRPLSD